MASLIKVRTISAATETAIALVNSQFARLVSIGTSWNTIRVGVRIHMADVGNVYTSGTPRFAMGLCAGTTNIFGDATTDHFAGIVTTPASWNYSAGLFYGTTNFYNPCKKVGTTLTTGTNFGTNVIATPATGANRSCLFVDIIKGSPNYSFKIFAQSDLATMADVSNATFLTQMEQATPALSLHTYTSAQTVAVDESANGTFTAACVAWNRTEGAIEICDLAVARIA